MVMAEDSIDMQSHSTQRKPESISAQSQRIVKHFLWQELRTFSEITYFYSFTALSNLLSPHPYLVHTF
jgi:hypothetical protein